MHMPELIFCGGNNAKFAEIAILTGYHYGAQLPCTTYAPLYFADQNWKNPNRTAYMSALEKHRPYIASVIDWESMGQYAEVLSWAEEAAQYVKVVMIIPKVSGIQTLPRKIGSAAVRLGYSVPTKHGGTTLHLAEFVGWPVHLLGGSPGSQMRLSRYLSVQSADGNMHMKMANRGLFWEPGKRLFSNSWKSLIENDGKRWEGNGNHEAFRRSCVNIMISWSRLSKTAT